MIDFDRQTKRILSAIYNHKNGMPYVKISKKFGSKKNISPDDLQQRIYDFFKEGYIKTENPNYDFVVFQETGRILGISKNAVFETTSKANAFIQTIRWDLLKWLVPTVISLLAIIIATISLSLQFA